MGNYPSFLVHLISALGLYWLVYLALAYLRRKVSEDTINYWERLSQPAIAVLIVALFREAFDAHSVKSVFDAISWVLGAAGAVYLAHRLRKARG